MFWRYIINIFTSLVLILFINICIKIAFLYYKFYFIIVRKSIFEFPAVSLNVGMRRKEYSHRVHHQTGKILGEAENQLRFYKIFFWGFFYCFCFQCFLLLLIIFHFDRKLISFSFFGLLMNHFNGSCVELIISLTAYKIIY